MDLAFDYMQDDALPKDQGGAPSAPNAEQQPSLNDDLQDVYKAISSSAWGIKIGGFLGTVVKQGESVYNQAQKELAEVGEDATKGFIDLRESIMSRMRSLTQNTIQAPDTRDGDDSQSTPTKSSAPAAEDAEHHSESVLSRLRFEAAKRLKDLQGAEDAADEALLRFGGNVRDLLRDAISIAPPEESAQGSSTVLFESKDAQGRRAIHTSRFDAQLHVIHTSADRFTEDPSGAEYETWASEFDVEKRAEDISSDLAKFPELRSTMEQLVPDQIPYADFWKRYYFFRHGIETAESRRHDLLKEEEVGWDDDSDEETAPKEASKEKLTSAMSYTTLQPQAQSHPNPTEARKSNDEKSVPDSEASYDLVSGEASQKAEEDSVRSDSGDEWE